MRSALGWYQTRSGLDRVPACSGGPLRVLRRVPLLASLAAMLPRLLLLVTFVLVAYAGWLWSHMPVATPAGRQPVATAPGRGSVPDADDGPERAAAPRSAPGSAQTRSATAQPAVLWADEDYLPSVLELLATARNSITVTMFSCVLPSDPRPTHPVRRILDALIARQRAGVAVRVVLDQGAPAGRQGDGDEASGDASPVERAARYLADAGVAVRWDEAQRTTHTKSLVVDGRWCVVGSTNWSSSALTRNREQSVLLDDPTLASELTARFNALWDVATPVR